MTYTKDIEPAKRTSALKGALVFFIAVVLSACTQKSLSLFFDIPPPKPESEIPEEPASPANKTVDAPGIWTDTINTNSDQTPLPIEELSSWEDVLALMPKDYKGDADWSAAVRQGLVKPRTGADPSAQLASAFKYDFIIDNPKKESIFPHSAHTEWLGCKNCHMTLYPYKRNPATMKEMRKGSSCGACHGKVAFSLKKCKRCHL